MIWLQAPKFTFGNAQKLPTEKPKYDFYENALFLDDPITADLNRKPKQGVAKIGTEPRVSASTTNLKDATKLTGAEPRPTVLPRRPP